MRSATFGMALLVGLMAATAGCGDAPADSGAREPDSSAPASDSVSPSTEAPASDLPTLEPPTRPPSEPTDSAKQVTVAGTISLSADRPRCVNLVDDATGVTWTLAGALVEGDIDGAGPLAEGDRVQVTGRVRPDTKSGAESYACGIPITVERITRL